MAKATQCFFFFEKNNSDVRIRILVCEKKLSVSTIVKFVFYTFLRIIIAIRKSGFLLLCSQFVSNLAIRGCFARYEWYLQNLNCELCLHILDCFVNLSTYICITYLDDDKYLLLLIFRRSRNIPLPARGLCLQILIYEFWLQIQKIFSIIYPHSLRIWTKRE